MYIELIILITMFLIFIRSIIFIIKRRVNKNIYITFIITFIMVFIFLSIFEARYFVIFKWAEGVTMWGMIKAYTISIFEEYGLQNIILSSVFPSLTILYFRSDN